MEVEFQTRLEENRSLDIAACWYWIRKLQLCVYAGVFDWGLEAASRAEPLLWSTAGHLELAEYHFFAGAAHAGCVASKTSEAAQQHLPALLRHAQQLTIWAQNSPENFESRAALLLAELARIDGRMTDSMREFERAISSAESISSSARRGSRLRAGGKPAFRDGIVQHGAAIAYRSRSSI
ncbi:hypothetical protein ACU4GD_31975 [Cupriavidus basilensis]